MTWWGAYGTIFGEMALQNDKDRAATIESGSQRWNMVKPEVIQERHWFISMEHVWTCRMIGLWWSIHLTVTMQAICCILCIYGPHIYIYTILYTFLVYSLLMVFFCSLLAEVHSRLWVHGDPALCIQVVNFLLRLRYWTHNEMQGVLYGIWHVILVCLLIFISRKCFRRVGQTVGDEAHGRSSWVAIYSQILRQWFLKPFEGLVDQEMRYFPALDHAWWINPIIGIYFSTIKQ